MEGHEILKLNEDRLYLKLSTDIWYDTHKETMPKVGSVFLNGIVKEVLTYKEYLYRFPKSNKESFNEISENVIHKGFIRKISTDKQSYKTIVEYSVNPVNYTLDFQEE